MTASLFTPASYDVVLYVGPNKIQIKIDRGYH